MTPKERLAAVMLDLGLTITAEFIPWSKSRNANPDTRFDRRTLNWRITLHKSAQSTRAVLTTDYSAGIAHCPSYRQGERATNDYVAAITHETENGTRYALSGHATRKPILPDSTDVMASILSDSDVIDHPTFESWATDMGYDTDSRSAERTYRACLEIGLSLRAAVGESGLDALRTAAQDY